MTCLRSCGTEAGEPAKASHPPARCHGSSTDFHWPVQTYTRQGGRLHWYPHHCPFRNCGKPNHLHRSEARISYARGMRQSTGFCRHHRAMRRVGDPGTPPIGKVAWGVAGFPRGRTAPLSCVEFHNPPTRGTVVSPERRLPTVFSACANAGGPALPATFHGAHFGPDACRMSEAMSTTRFFFLWDAVVPFCRSQSSTREVESVS